MTIKEVTDKLSIKEFHEIPRIIYKDDTNYILHLENDIEDKFDKDKNKFNDTNKSRCIWCSALQSIYHKRHLEYVNIQGR